MVSLLTSLSRQAGINPGNVETVDPRYALSAVTLTANSVYLGLLPRLIAPVVVTGIEIYVGTASGNVDVGVYSFDGTTFTLLSSSGSTAVSPTNDYQAVALTATVTIPRYAVLDYYLGVCPDNATATLGRAAGQANANKRGNRSMLKASAFPLATNGTAITGASGTGTSVWARTY